MSEFRTDQLTFSNSKVQRLRRLLGRRSARLGDDAFAQGAFVVEGSSLVAQAHLSGWAIEGLYLAAGVVPESLGLPSSIAATARVFELGTGVMERVATTETPPPILAVVERRTVALADAIAGSFVVVADAIGDPGNAGTILRSAEAAGADAVVLTAGSVDPFNPKVARASAGALFTVPVVVDVTLDEVAAAARPRGVTVYGTTSHLGASGSVSYLDADLSAPCAIALGNEARGLDPAVPVDGWITIPHAGRAESLNVAMAATVLAFEVARQRRHAGGTV